jgi:glycosyltransferase involved in cell wall biosynthesis
MNEKFSIVIPAKNEAEGLKNLLPELRTLYSSAEIIVVDDGSTDNTVEVVVENGARVVSHPYSKGNGSAIKTGARSASFDTLVFMDADGQHQPKDVGRLVAELESGYDMVIGARTKGSQASAGRAVANKIYNRLASFMVNRKVDDLTSGFRAVNAEKFLEFLALLPNGFSYPTTITMAFFRAGYSVQYIPIKALARVGSSNIRLLHDGVRFMLIIFKVGTLYSPLKIFLPISALHFLVGASYYAYTYITMSRFTNMGATMIMISVLIFLMGLISEQITMLLYVNHTEKK